MQIDNMEILKGVVTDQRLNNPRVKSACVIDIGTLKARIGKSKLEQGLEDMLCQFLKMFALFLLH